MFHLTTSEFPDNVWVRQHLFSVQQLDESRVCLPEVANPNGTVHKNRHDTLRLRPELAPGSDPPRAANRLALRLATKASSPIRTNAVFSDTPVRSDAFFRIASSMLSVVRMHIMMHTSYALVKGANVALSRAAR